MKLVLASNSIYRKDLLRKLGLEFVCARPDLNEEALKVILEQQQFSPEALAERLSYEKGHSVFLKQSEACIVISGDQLVSYDNQILGKPLTVENAIGQLQRLNNRTHQLITALTIFNAGLVIKYNHISHLKMKNLTEREIINYVRLDNPIDCAGSYKIEKHGITLFESIDCDDFTAIQGIPVLWLSNYLKGNGYEFFKI